MLLALFFTVNRNFDCKLSFFAQIFHKFHPHFLTPAITYFSIYLVKLLRSNLPSLKFHLSFYPKTSFLPHLFNSLSAQIIIFPFYATCSYITKLGALITFSSVVFFLEFMNVFQCMNI